MRDLERSQPPRRTDFHIAIICALRIESDAVEALFDQRWDAVKIGKAQRDPNSYATGRIGQHDVILAFMPGVGKARSASVTAALRASFVNISLALVVGICGGSPVTAEGDCILLGDVIISNRVIQSDFGRQFSDSLRIKDTLTDSLARPSHDVSSFLAKMSGMQAGQEMRDRSLQYLYSILQKDGFEGWQYPGLEEDTLYKLEYRHKHQPPRQCALCSQCVDESDPVCDFALSAACEELGCSDEMLSYRGVKARENTPSIHQGVFASSDQTIRSAPHREKLLQSHKAIGFEMEGAGVWDSLPTIIVKSVCDYADSHKNKKWQRYAAATAAAVAKALLAEWTSAADASDGGKYNIAFSLRNVPVTKTFVNRSAEMAKLEEHLLAAGKERRKISVLRGMGGIGKTQLAVEFLRRHHDKFSAVFWLDGSSVNSLKQSLAGHVGRLPSEHISENSRVYSRGGNGDIDAVTQEMLRWLSRPDNSNWLLIYDNVDREYSTSNPDPLAYDIKQYFPDADHGTILVTTRLARLKQLGDSQQVQRVDKDTMRAIFRTWYKKDYDEVDETRLFECLDGLPLAVAQAGAYLQQTEASLQTYVRLYTEQWEELHKHQDADDISLDGYTGRSIWTTWTISYNTILAKDESVANLLLLWSHIDSKDVWFGMFQRASQIDATAIALSGRLKQIANQETAFNRAIGLLQSYSLIEASEVADAYSMHAVVHQWAYHYQGRRLQDLRRLAVVLIGSAVPSQDERNYSHIQRRLISHAQVCSDHIMTVEQYILETLPNSKNSRRENESMPEDAGIWFAVNNFGNLYRDQGKLDAAEQMFMRALQGYEKALGPDHTSTLNTVNNLGNLYLDQGKLVAAEQMYIRALQGYEKALGPDHTSILNTVNNLGNLYRNQGKLEAAEQMYMRALQGKEKALGPDHTSTLSTVNNLGLLYRNQGKLEAAEQIYIRALQGYEKALGPDHTSTLDTVNNLGNLYRDQGKLDAAEQMFMRALQGYEKALGPDHTLTLGTVNNLGLLYRDQGKLDAAEQIYIRALQGYEKALGPDHTSTLNTVNNLGILYLDQGKLVAAEQMYIRALQGYEKALGPDHTLTLGTVNNLGLLYRDQGKLDAAEQMYIRALQGYEKALGPNHTSTLGTVNNLGLLYRDQGKLEAAEQMYMRALQGKEKALGPDHTSTLSTVNNLGILYRDQGKLEAAEQMYIRALQGYEKALGPDHTSTLSTVNNLGLLYRDQGKLKAAEQMYMRALQGKEKALGPDHTSTLNTVNNLGALYFDQGKVEAAEQMFMRALQGYEKALYSDHASILLMKRNLQSLREEKDRSSHEREDAIKSTLTQGKDDDSEPSFSQANSPRARSKIHKKLKDLLKL